MSDQHRDMFAGLVMMMSQSALLHLGKLVNPATGKTEVKLEYAQEAIDTLDMLEAKTRGNLDAAEAKMLKETLAYLKINYVETSQTPAAPAAKPGVEAKESPAAAADAPPAPTPEPPPGDAESKVRYRKSFG
jgi:hypothetical protein